MNLELLNNTTLPPALPHIYTVCSSQLKLPTTTDNLSFRLLSALLVCNVDSTVSHSH
jgi:hypothetical protein